MAESYGMFGPSAAETGLMLDQEGQNKDLGWANLSPQQAIMRTAAQSGRMAGQALQGVAGYQDPRIAKTKILEEAKMEVDASGANLLDNPTDYYGKAYEALQKRGLSDEAMNVRQLLLSQGATEADTRYKNAQADKLDREGNIVPLGAGGGYDQRTDKVIPPAGGTSKNAKETQQLVELLKDPELDPVSRKFYEDRLEKITSNKPSDMSILAGVIGGGYEAQIEAARIIAQAKAAGKGTEDYVNTIYEDADSAAATISQLNTIETTLKTTDMTFGALGEARRSIAGVVSLIAPDLADDLDSVMKFDTVAYDSVERASSNILTRLAQEAGGQRTNLLLKTLEKAGPAVWQTNAGLRIIALANRKTQQFKMDKAAYLDTLNPTDNVRQKMRLWTAENFDKPEYNITENEMRSIKVDVKKMQMLSNVRAGSAGPLPPKQELITKGKIYYIENNPKYKDGYYKAMEKGLSPMSVE